ncbi:M20/M25/M40 family metallo-hydrolase [Flavobacterium sp.]|uniref:M20/M25/M40 family metallo-hydrolase n=1 Tax=Flavobacterium sp. TaxID=239 RepID=UPI002488EF69|nr:M20/M25/M40 family metallo-hydrolase [Flavobacterium sp.]MDI1317386.1 M20/M25/M40 family metallo-hydrolase [Flavobacterium sp.]
MRLYHLFITFFIVSSLSVYAQESNLQKKKAHESDVFIADCVNSNGDEHCNPANLKKHISFLASDDLKGRLTGSKQEKVAAKYLISEFKKRGIKPYDKNYIQSFSYTIRLNPHDTISQSKSNTGNNVIGYLDNGADRTIIIGAHYDHLGLNEHHHSTKMNSDGEIHNGADDNASGVSGVLELARMFSQNRTKEKANFIFALFSGEEDGLLGSKHMASNLKTIYPNVETMINMDMIGRLDDKKSIIVGGAGTCPSFPEIIENNKPAGYKITQELSGIGPSDHTSFYLKDIPVLFFFTGTHVDYHKPSDDEDKINYHGLENIVNYVYKSANAVAQLDKIEFTKTKIIAEKNIPKYKVTLGIMPDYAEYGDGLHVDGVTENRPAQLAGIQTGDIITKIGDCIIKEVYSYMECLAKINSGDEKDVSLIRNGQIMIFKVKF